MELMGWAIVAPFIVGVLLVGLGAEIDNHTDRKKAKK